MLKLYYHPICPLSNQVRIILNEFNMDYTMIKEEYWMRREEFLKINLSSNLPVIETDKFSSNLIGVYPIIEYMAETFEDFYLMPKSNDIRAKIRYYTNWFNEKFYREVSKILIDEKMIRLLMRKDGPRSNFIKASKVNLTHHFSYLTQWLIENPNIVGEKISCVDIVAASHIATIDYFGEINWDSWGVIKNWYSIVKSRPSFQAILQDRIAGLNPPKHYGKLDF